MVRFALVCLLSLIVAAQGITIEFSQQNLVPEGVDFSYEHYFLVGSIGTGQIYSVDLDGNIEQLSSTNELTSSVGIQVDEENDRIYVANNALPFPTNNDQAGVVVLRLSDGAFVNNFDLTKLGPTGEPKVLNDLTLPDSKRNIYATDSTNGIIYRVNLDTAKTEVFLESDELKPADVFLGLGVGVNGIEIWQESGEEYLLVTRTGNSSSTAALYKVDLLSSNPVLRNVDLPDIPYPAFDGLVFNRNTGHLFGVAHQSDIVELSSEDSWKTASVVNTYVLDSPGVTTCVVVDNSVFGLANSFFAGTGPYYIEQGDSRNVDFSLSETSGSSGTSQSNNNSSSPASVLQFSSCVLISLVALVLSLNIF